MYNIKQYHQLRNDLWTDLVGAGVVSDDDENFQAFDSVLGNKLKVNWDE